MTCRQRSGLKLNHWLKPHVWQKHAVDLLWTSFVVQQILNSTVAVTVCLLSVLKHTGVLVCAIIVLRYLVAWGILETVSNAEQLRNQQH